MPYSQLRGASLNETAGKKWTHVDMGLKWPMEGAGAAALCGFDIGLPKGLTPMVGAASPEGAVFGASPSFPVALGSTWGLGWGPTGVGLCI